MRVSRSGLVIAAAYTALSLGSVVWGYSLTAPKESTVLMQLPVVPALIFLDAFGLLERTAGTPLIVFYGVCIPLIAFGLYAACWLFGALGARARMVIGFGVLVVLSVQLLWPVRRQCPLGDGVAAAPSIRSSVNSFGLLRRNCSLNGHGAVLC